MAIVRFLLISALALAAAQGAAQRRYVDEAHGYAVHTVSKWNALPVPPTMPTVKARWASPRLDQHGAGRMLVHVFERDQPGRADTSGTSAPLPERPPRTPSDRAARLRRFLGRYRSYQSWARERRGLELPAPQPLRKVKAPKGVPVTANLYEAEHRGWYVVVGVYVTPKREYAVELLCPLKAKRKYRRTFRRIASSLEILPAGKQAPAPQPGATAREKALARARRDATRVPGWWYLESENYFFVTNVPRKKKGRILDLRRRLEAIRKTFEKDYPPLRPIQAVSIVRVCKNRTTYHQYGGPAGSAGYWNPVAEELVLYMAGNKDFARSVLNHEAFHQYIHYATGGVRLHTWFNEGNADYYGGCEVRGRRVIVGRNPMRMDTIRNHCHLETYVPLAKILRYSQAQYYRDAARCYAQGWALVYFLREGVAADHPWARILPTYYRVVCQTRSAQKALRAAFRGVDLKRFEKAWVRFITRGDRVRP